jgi:DNA invertase Pin-like site-specific DNA recombinase
MQAAKEWCQNNGYTLSDDRFRDAAKSAFKGKNLEGEGDLKRFVSLIEEGKIKRGSVLVLESFDRLSRLTPSKAVGLFLDIINAGIGMVFTMTFDKRLITEKMIEDEGYILYAIIGEAQRSHNESKYKSQRVKEAYDARKQKAIASDTKYLAWCPPWCDYDKKLGYVLNEDRAKLVRRIFDEYLQGCGAYRISRILNKEGLPTLGHRALKQYKNTAKTWYKKTVRDFLYDKRVYGYCEFLDKENYYPAVVTKDKFNAAQHRLALRSAAIRTGGPTEKLGNLFSGVCRCAQCGSVMSKTSTRKRYKDKITLYEYLVCEGARQGNKCTYRSVPYIEFEREMLETLRCDTFFQSMTDNSPTKEIEQRLASLSGERLTNGRQIAKLMSMILGDDKPSTTLADKLKELESRQQQIDREVKLINAQMDSMQNLPIIAKEIQDQTDAMLKTKEGRLKVREFINRSIESIVIDVVTPESLKYDAKINWKPGFQGTFVMFEGEETEGEFGVVRVKLTGPKKVQIKIPKK